MMHLLALYAVFAGSSLLSLTSGASTLKRARTLLKKGTKYADTDTGTDIIGQAASPTGEHADRLQPTGEPLEPLSQFHSLQLTDEEQPKTEPTAPSKKDRKPKKKEIKLRNQVIQSTLHFMKGFRTLADTVHEVMMVAEQMQAYYDGRSEKPIVKAPSFEEHDHVRVMASVLITTPENIDKVARDLWNDLLLSDRVNKNAAFLKYLMLCAMKQIPEWRSIAASEICPFAKSLGSEFTVPLTRSRTWEILGRGRRLPWRVEPLNARNLLDALVIITALNGHFPQLASNKSVALALEHCNESPLDHFNREVIKLLNQPLIYIPRLAPREQEVARELMTLFAERLNGLLSRRGSEGQQTQQIQQQQQQPGQQLEQQSPPPPKPVNFLQLALPRLELEGGSVTDPKDLGGVSVSSPRNLGDISVPSTKKQ